MYYEVPEKIFLNDACGSHAVIFKRTASQQRICLAVFVVMQFIQYGRFTVKSRPEGEPEHMPPPSLQILQRLQCDHENVFLKEYIVEISNDTSFMTNDQFCLLPCAAVFLAYNIQPLAEVILPFSREDERKMISSRKLTPYWKTKHIAVMKMIDAHFQNLPYTRYYTTERWTRCSARNFWRRHARGTLRTCHDGSDNMRVRRISLLVPHVDMFMQG
jgi:hypothetical protein